MQGELLFGKASVFDVIKRQEQRLCEYVERLDGEQLLSPSVGTMVEHLVARFALSPPKLHSADMTQDSKEKAVSREDDFGRRGSFKALLVRVFVPFEGDSDLFRVQPSTAQIHTVRATVQQSQLILTYEHTALHEDLRQRIDADVRTIENHLQWLSADLDKFNADLARKAGEWVEQRRAKRLADQNLVASLKIPLRERDDTPKTYSAPVARRKLPVTRTKTGASTFAPEPSLAQEHYEHILSVISDMAKVMERSPHAFATMGEEDLRTHFLVQLNGHYEGQATGETFNFEGKTDILIRHEGRNIFIAECKFWDGPKALVETIDQILGYASWRDTKVAIVVFNRRKDLSGVLAKIPDIVAGHANFLRRVDYQHETGFRFVMHHRDDALRELTMTVLVFDVPEPSPPKGT